MISFTWSLKIKTDLVAYLTVLNHSSNVCSWQSGIFWIILKLLLPWQLCQSAAWLSLLAERSSMGKTLDNATKYFFKCIFYSAYMEQPVFWLSHIFRGMLSCIINIFKEEGFAGFYVWVVLLLVQFLLPSYLNLSLPIIIAVFVCLQWSHTACPGRRSVSVVL